MRISRIIVLFIFYLSASSFLYGAEDGAEDCPPPADMPNDDKTMFRCFAVGSRTECQLYYRNDPSRLVTIKVYSKEAVYSAIQNAVRNGSLDPACEPCFSSDLDKDGYSDCAEFLYGTNYLTYRESPSVNNIPGSPDFDIDGDGYSDAQEEKWGTDPLDPYDSPDKDVDSPSKPPWFPYPPGSEPGGGDGGNPGDGTDPGGDDGTNPGGGDGDGGEPGGGDGEKPGDGEDKPGDGDKTKCQAGWVYSSLLGTCVPDMNGCNDIIGCVDDYGITWLFDFLLGISETAKRQEQIAKDIKATLVEMSDSKQDEPLDPERFDKELAAINAVKEAVNEAKGVSEEAGSAVVGQLQKNLEEMKNSGTDMKTGIVSGLTEVKRQLEAMGVADSSGIDNVIAAIRESDSTESSRDSAQSAILNQIKETLAKVQAKPGFDDSALLNRLNQMITKLDKPPTVNVGTPTVNVSAPDVNLDPLLTALNGIAGQLDSGKVDLDTSSLETALGSLETAVANGGNLSGVEGRLDGIKDAIEKGGGFSGGGGGGSGEGDGVDLGTVEGRLTEIRDMMKGVIEGGDGDGEGWNGVEDWKKPEMTEGMASTIKPEEIDEFKDSILDAIGKLGLDPSRMESYSPRSYSTSFKLPVGGFGTNIQWKEYSFRLDDLSVSGVPADIARSIVDLRKVLNDILKAIVALIFLVRTWHVVWG